MLFSNASMATGEGSFLIITLIILPHCDLKKGIGGLEKKKIMLSRLWWTIMIHKNHPRFPAKHPKFQFPVLGGQGRH